MKTKKKAELLRCEFEGCDGQVLKDAWPRGWIQTGASKFGEEYDREGIASWCPKHNPRK